MAAAAFIVLPIAILTWLLTTVALWLLRGTPSRYAWLDRNRWWFVWPLLALYLGLIGGWTLGVFVLCAGVAILGWHLRAAPAK